MERAYANIVIPSSATKSVLTSIPNGFVLSGIITPATLTGASISLEGTVIPTSGTAYPVYNGGTLYSVAMGTSRLITFDTNITKGLTSFILVSGSAEAADRTFVAIYTRDR